MRTKPTRTAKSKTSDAPASTGRHDILRGTLEVLVLQAISSRPRHGFDIAIWLESGALAVDDSALYQALHRLEARAFILGEWKMSENNRRARYYRLTTAGRAHLAGESAKLVSYTRTIAALLSPTNGKS